MRNAQYTASTSRPKKPNTGQAPISQNARPAAKLTTLRNPISTRKPVRFSERCGVSSAENNFGSACSGSKSLPAVMTCQYTRIMPKIIRKPVPKAKPANPAQKVAKAGGKAAGEQKPL